MADVEEKLNIYVKDDGEGMEPQMLDELQEEARRGKKEGNKLGLAELCDTDIKGTVWGERDDSGDEQKAGRDHYSYIYAV